MPVLFGKKISAKQHGGLRIETHFGGKGRGTLLYEQAAGEWPSEIEIRQAIGKMPDLEKVLESKGRQSQNGVWEIPARWYIGDEDETFDLAISSIVFGRSQSDPMDRAMAFLEAQQRRQDEAAREERERQDKRAQEERALLLQLFQEGFKAIGQQQQVNVQALADLHKASTGALADQHKASAEERAANTKAAAEGQAATARLLEQQSAAVTRAAEVATAAFEKQVQKVEELQGEAGNTKIAELGLQIIGPAITKRLAELPGPSEN